MATLLAIWKLYCIFHYQEVLADKQRMEHEVNELQNLRREDKIEMDELRQQQREVISESGSSEVINKMYDNANAKYEATKHDYDQLRKRYCFHYERTVYVYLEDFTVEG